MDFNSIVAFLLNEYNKGNLKQHPTEIMSSAFIDSLLKHINENSHELQRQNRIAIEALRKIAREEGSYNADKVKQIQSIVNQIKQTANKALRNIDSSDDLPPEVKQTLAKTSLLTPPSDPEDNQGL